MWLPPDLVALCRTTLDGREHTDTDQLCDTTPHQHQTKSPPPSPPKQSTSEAFPLLSLPLDILTMHLPAHLPHTTLYSLRLSNKTLQTAIPEPKKRPFQQLDECERKAMLTAMEESSERSTRRCCVICGSWYPIALFTWGPDGEEDTDGSKQTPRRGTGIANRVCRWHRARFERTVLDKGRRLGGWSLEEACMHCGGVLAWGRCDCEGPCQICWKREVWCYTRVCHEAAVKDITKKAPEHYYP